MKEKDQQHVLHSLDMMRISANQIRAVFYDIPNIKLPRLSQPIKLIDEIRDNIEKLKDITHYTKVD